jgi:hypothetical protein
LAGALGNVAVLTTGADARLARTVFRTSLLAQSFGAFRVVPATVLVTLAVANAIAVDRIDTDVVTHVARVRARAPQEIACGFVVHTTLVFGRVAIRLTVHAIVLALQEFVTDQARQSAIVETRVRVRHASGLASLAILVALNLARFVRTFRGAVTGPANLIAGAVAGDRLRGAGQKKQNPDRPQQGGQRPRISLTDHQNTPGI